MNKKTFLVIMAIITILILTLYLTRVLFQGNCENQNIELKLLIKPSKDTFSTAEHINIICSILNNDNKNIKIWGNTETADIYDNNYLTFKIRDSNGSLIRREGAVHGIGKPLVLHPGENITVIADLNKYFPLNNITGHITIQAIYSCYGLQANNGDVLCFEGTLESNTIIIEVLKNGTDPTSCDSDEDEFNDKQEIDGGANPMEYTYRWLIMLYSDGDNNFYSEISAEKEDMLSHYSQLTYPVKVTMLFDGDSNGDTVYYEVTKNGYTSISMVRKIWEVLIL